jgi:hypothetical protein
MTWGWYQATKMPSLVGGPGGKGVGGGVGVGEGSGVEVGATSVLVGTKGESRGEWNGSGSDAVGQAVSVAEGVGRGVLEGVELGNDESVARRVGAVPAELPSGALFDGPLVVRPHADRSADSAAAPAPCRKRRRVRESLSMSIRSF